MARELSKLSEQCSYRLQPKDVTHECIEYFMDTIWMTYASSASMLMQLLTGLMDVNMTPARDPDTIRRCIASMLLFLTSRESNGLQMALGLYLHSAACPKCVIKMLSSIGLSVSPTTIYQTLVSLTEDALCIIREKAMQSSWFLVYDNINISQR